MIPRPGFGPRPENELPRTVRGSVRSAGHPRTAHFRSESTGVKSGPAVICGCDPLEIAAIAGGVNSPGSPPAANIGLAAGPFRQVNDRFGHVARLVCHRRPHFEHSAVPASHCWAAVARTRLIGTRRHEGAPSTWYSSTNVFRSRFSSLTSQAHPGVAAAPAVRLEQHRGRKRVDDDFHVWLDGRVQWRRDLAVDRQDLDRKPVFAVVHCPKRKRGMIGKRFADRTPVVAHILGDQQVELLDPFTALGIQLKRNAKVPPLVEDSRRGGSAIPVRGTVGGKQRHGPAQSAASAPAPTTRATQLGPRNNRRDRRRIGLTFFCSRTQPRVAIPRGFQIPNSKLQVDRRSRFRKRKATLKEARHGTEMV